MFTTGKTSPRRVVQAGQGLVEYALILSCVAALAIGAAFFLGGRINGVLSNVGNSVGGAVAGVVSTQTTTTTPREGDLCKTSKGKVGTYQYEDHVLVCQKGGDHGGGH